MLGSRILSKIAIVVAIGMVACSAPEPWRPVPPRHVFLLVIDTLRADHLGSYGYSRPTSPNLDRLAREGRLYENSFAASSNTLESTLPLFASTSGLTTRLYEEGVPTRYVSLQKRMREGGFNTLAVIANPWLKYHEEFFADGIVHRKFVNEERGDYWGVNTTAEVTDLSLDMLERNFDRSGKNFFYIHYLDPHDEYRSPVDYGFHAGPTPEPRPIAHALSGEERIHQLHRKDPEFFGRARPRSGAAEAREFLVAQCDQEIRFVDDQLGRLLERLEEMDVLDDSLIVVTSDHGEGFLEHGMLKHGFQLYDEAIRVPQILYGPNAVPPGRDDRVVSGIDIAPTLLEQTGLEIPGQMLGRSLLDLSAERDPAVFCTHFINQRQRGMRTERWKIIEDLRAGTTEVYDLHADPGELHDLYEGDRTPWAGLFAGYEAQLERHARDENEERTEDPDMDDQTREQLRSLGYLQ